MLRKVGRNGLRKKLDVDVVVGLKKDGLIQRMTGRLRMFLTAKSTERGLHLEDVRLGIVDSSKEVLRKKGCVARSSEGLVVG